MARSKRLEKKRKAEEKIWVDRAEKLYLKGEDEAFLASARRRASEIPPALADAYAEVRERVVRGALDTADLTRLETELEHGRVGGGAGYLAQALVCFLGGDDEGAREAVRGAEGEEVPEGLNRGLSALLDGADCEALPARTRDVVESFRRLRSMAAAAAAGRGTGRKALDHPTLETVRRMIDALVAMRHRDYCPGAGSAAKLVAACARYADCDPDSSTVVAVAPRAHVLNAVIEAEKSVRAGRGGAAGRAIQGLESVVDQLGILTQRPPRQAAAVHFASRRRVRRLLAAVAEAEGAEGLAALVAAVPALAGEVALGGQVLHADDRLLEAVRLRDPCERMHPSEFAERVARLAKAEADPLRNAQLVQLELDARLAQVDLAFEEEEDPKRVTGGIMDRVGRVAQALKRLPPAFAREMAKLLRADLAELSFSVQAGQRWRVAAEALLVHLPGDPFLLVFAVAGARAGGDSPGVERLLRTIEAAPVQKAEPELFEPLLEGLAPEAVETLEVALGALRQLISQSAWEQVRPLAAASFGRFILDELEALNAEFEPFLGGEFGSSPAEFMVSRVGLLDRHLEGEAEFDALQVVLACVTDGAAATTLRIDGYLAQNPGFEAARALYRGLRRVRIFRGGNPAMLQLVARLAAAVVEAVEPGRPHTWLEYLGWLADDLDAEGLIRLGELVVRERELSDDPTLIQILDQMAFAYLGHASMASAPMPSLPMPEPEHKPVRRRSRAAAKRSEDQLKLF